MLVFFNRLKWRFLNADFDGMKPGKNIVYQFNELSDNLTMISILHLFCAIVNICAPFVPGLTFTSILFKQHIKICVQTQPGVFCYPLFRANRKWNSKSFKFVVIFVYCFPGIIWGLMFCHVSNSLLYGAYIGFIYKNNTITQPIRQEFFTNFIVQIVEF